MQVTLNMTKTHNKTSKISLLLLIIYLCSFFSACGKSESYNDNQLLSVPEINFNYKVITTDYNISDFNAAMMHFNCEFILPDGFSYNPDSESILRLKNNTSRPGQQDNLLGKQMINLIDIHCNSKNDSLSDNAFIKDLFDKNTDSVKEYFINYNNMTLKNANKFSPDNKYEIVDQNVDIQYYKSIGNSTIASLSAELVIRQENKDETDVLYIIYYYREDLPDVYIVTGTTEQTDPAQHYGIHIINSLKITQRVQI